MDWLVHGFKYSAQLGIGELFGQLLATRLSATTDPLPELLLPTPLHPGRLRLRGFNQALEIGRILERRLDITLVPSGLQRRRATISQTGLSLRERRRNIRGAFSVHTTVEGRRVALLDDVLTTGSTAAELTRMLLRAGAVDVSVWTIARAYRRP